MSLEEERWIAHRREHLAEQKAIESAASDIDRRLEGMNNFREQLLQQAATFARTDDLEHLDAKLDTVRDELRIAIANEREERRGTSKQGVSQVAAVFLATLAAGGTAVGIIATLLAIFGGTP